MIQELIAGQCENCGTDYRFETVLDYPVFCPTCKLETQNWDTVGYSQMAPFMIEIIK
jgi:predicted Zn-ribbon and HTH transcriptional regulator